MMDAYRIGVTLSLTNHVSRGLMLMAGDFAKTEAQATLLQKRLNSIQNDALKGGLMVGAGVGMLAMLKGPYEEAKKLAMAQANFQTMNLSATENSQAFAKAASMSHSILGTTISGNVKLIHDLHMAFGDLHHAIESADIFAKMSIVAKVANGGKDVDGLANAAAKALEHRGGKVINNASEFAKESDMMTQVMLATKMRVSPKDYLTASGTGKMAYQMFDKEFLYGNFAGMMAINGGARSGTAGMTAFSSLIGGHMDSKGKGFLADLGLYQEGFSKKRLGLMNQSMAGMSPEEKRIAIASMGGQAVISGGLSDANSELYAHRPDLFISKVLLPAIKQRFGFNLTDEQIALMVAKNFNRNTGDFLGTQITMASKLAKDTAIVQKAMGNESGYQHYMRSPEGAEEAASAAFTNFLAMFGSVYVPAITSGLLKLAKGLDSLSQWVGSNSGAVKLLVSAFVTLATGLLIRGSVLLLGAAVKGLGLASLSASQEITKSSKLIGAAGSFFMGWQLGTWLHDVVTEGTKFDAWLGGVIAHLMAPFSSDAREAVEGTTGRKIGSIGSGIHTLAGIMPVLPLRVIDALVNGGEGGAVAPKARQAVVVEHTTNIDSQVLFKKISPHFAKAASAPQLGSGRFDPGLMPASPGMNLR